MEAKRMNTTVLAFLGDAVYELYVREHVMKGGTVRADRLNRAAVSLVRAESQARAVRELMKDFLTEEEIALVKRGRNATKTSKPRSATHIDYKMATGLEALIGYLYTSGQSERLREVMAETVRIIEGK